MPSDLQYWKDHLLALDHLRQGINLRAYGQRDPLNEYKREAFTLFAGMLDEVREQVTRYLSNIVIQTQPPQDMPPFPPQEMHETRRDPALDMEPGFIGSDQLALAAAPQMAAGTDMSNVPRNAPCPCGSGKKFKHCHGATG